MKTLQNVVNGIQQNDKTFLISPETGKFFTYKELKPEFDKINCLLKSLGIGKGETVSFLLDNGIYTTILFLGIIYSGRVVLPLNMVAGKNNLNYTLEHSEAKAVFLSQRHTDLYKSLEIASNVKEIYCDENQGLKLKTDLSATELPEVKQDDIAVLIYTSGTTGQPKGVLLSHKNIIAGGHNTILAHNLTEHDIGLCVLPLYHINAEIVSVMATILSAGTLVISLKLSVSKFWSWISDYKCTWFSVVPTIVSYLIHDYELDNSIFPKDKIKKHLRFGRSASAALAPAVHKKFEKIFSISIIETMGISEAAAQILSNPMLPEKIKYGSPGVAVGNEIRIVDANNMEVARGEKGEIVVRGDNVMRGYLKNPDETRKTLDQDGWLHTGDLGYMDNDGFVFVTGRLKELIIKGGENISPREIDDVLYKHPAILEAVAFPVANEYYGQEIMAAVVLKVGNEINIKELKEYCTRYLGKYKTPEDIWIVAELPKGPSGKIQRLKLVEDYARLGSLH